MNLGIIGVGHLAKSILKGLLRARHATEDIVLSPRGEGESMAETHGFRLASDNADLVDRCDIVLLSVRPVDAANAIRDLPWRSDQLLMSACAGVPKATLEDAAPLAQIIRIMPITAAEQGASPTLVYPLVPEIQPFLDAIGSTIALESEAQFEIGTVSAAVYGWAQALIRTGAVWNAQSGLDPSVARQLAARTFVAAGLMQTDESQTMDATLASLCTPGGITEAGLHSLEQAGTPEAWEKACALVLRRLRAPKG